MTHYSNDQWNQPNHYPPVNHPGGQPVQVHQPYLQPAHPAVWPAPMVAAPSSTSSTLSIFAFVLSPIAVLFLPILFGTAAIVCGAVATSRGEKTGMAALVVAICCTVLGFILGALTFMAY